MVDGVFNHINPITFPAVRPHCMGNSTCKGGVSLTGVIGAQKHQSWLNNGSKLMVINVNHNLIIL
jgi:hypothetical protein